MILSNELENRGIELAGKSDAGKKLNRFEDLELSTNTFSLMSKNQCFRFIFNYIIKHGSFSKKSELSEIKKALIEEIVKDKKSVSESFVLKNTCKCGEEVKELFWDNLRTNCPNCGLELHNWEETKQVDEHHVEKLLGKMEDKGILDRQLDAHCISCDKVKSNLGISKEDSADKIFCENCDRILDLSISYGFSSNIDNLEKQGYWLEWYMKELLVDEEIVPSKSSIENSMNYRLKENEKIVNGGEIDVVSLITGADKILTISCYDTHNKVTAGKFQEILQFTEHSDIIIFATTGRINRDSCKHILDHVDSDLILIEGDKLENIGDLIRERLVEEFSEHLEEEDIDKISSYLYLYSYSYPESEKEELVNAAIKQVQEKGVLEFIKMFARIDYREFNGFPERIAQEIEDETIYDEGREISKLFNSNRWERIALSLIFLRNCYGEISEKNKETFFSELERLSSHRSVYVRNEVIKTVEKLYDKASPEFVDELNNVIIELSSDGTYVESKAKELMSDYDVSVEENGWFFCKFCNEPLPDKQYYDHHLQLEHERTLKQVENNIDN